MELIGVITFALAILSFIYGEKLAVPGFVVCSLLGAAAAINASGIGSIQPAHILLGSTSAVVLLNREHVRRISLCLQFPNPGFWLACALLYGAIGAIFIPRIAAGNILVNAIGITSYGVTFSQVPLGPTTGNFTQTIYFAGDLVCFLICYAVACTDAGFRMLTQSLLAYCLGDIFMAFMDIATFQTGTTFLLDPIRNANYVIFVDSGATASKRIIGSYSEASAFAGAGMGVFGFSSQLWIEGFRPYVTLTVSLTILLLLFFSTSSTALVSLPFCFIFLFVASFQIILGKNVPINAFVFVVLVPLLFAILIMAIMLHAPTYTALMDFLDLVIFSKSTSESGIDRGTVNVEAWENFTGSFGIGLGIGSVRAFSFALAVLANLGIFGGIAYAAFIGTALWKSGENRSGTRASVKSAARIACLSLITASCVSGALIDLGLPFFVFAGLAASRRDQEDVLMLPSAVI